MIQAVTTMAYGIVAYCLIRYSMMYTTLRWLLAACGLHLLVVTVRTSLLIMYPESVMWPWPVIHRITILVAAIAAVMEWRRRIRAVS